MQNWPKNWRILTMLKMREEIMAMLESGALSNSTGFADYLRGLARQVPGGLC